MKIKKLMPLKIINLESCGEEGMKLLLRAGSATSLWLLVLLPLADVPRMTLKIDM